MGMIPLFIEDIKCIYIGAYIDYSNIPSAPA